MRAVKSLLIGIFSDLLHLKKRYACLFVLVVIFSQLVSVSASEIDLRVKVYDYMAPTNVSDFEAQPGNRKIKLSWVNPSDKDFAGVKIRYKTSDYPKRPTDGEVVYNASYKANSYNTKSDEFYHSGLKNGVRYYYTAFAYDKAGNYSSGTITSGIPETSDYSEDGKGSDSSSKNAASKTSEALTEGLKTSLAKENASRKIKLNLYVKQDFGWLKSFNNNSLYAGQEVLISIPANYFSKEVQSIIITLNESSYLMSLKNNNFETTIKAPKTSGVYDLIFNIRFKDGSRLVRYGNSLLVKPRSYVYSRLKSIWMVVGLKKPQEKRVSRTKVYLYFYDAEEGKWQLWNSKKYKQKNPKETNKDGEYEFIVPSGRYYLVAKKKGYLPTKTASFKVNNKVFNKNIELKKAFSAGAITVYSSIFILAAGFIFLFFRRRVL